MKRAADAAVAPGPSGASSGPFHAAAPASRLALDGGEPVRHGRLPYARQSVEEPDVRAVVAALRSERLTTGPEVGAFEDAFAAYVGARHAVSVASGTAALHAAAFAAGLGPGDEAITSPLTFCATANCALYLGGRPVFADVEPDTLTLDPEQVERRLGPRTRAILPVDYGGHPAALDAIMAIGRRRGLTVIEDGCHALGAEIGGRRVGAVSDMTVFSLHPVKPITTGEGGMVTTNDDGLARRLRLFRNHGIDQQARGHHPAGPWYYEMTALGHNFRLTDLACALGRSQLARAERLLVRRREIAARYLAELSALPELELPAARPGCTNAWHLFPLRLRLERLRAGRAEVFRALHAEGLDVNVHYIPVPWHPYYRRLGYGRGEWPVAESAYERLISIPLFGGMSARDEQDVIAAVTKVVAHFRR